MAKSFEQFYAEQGKQNLLDQWGKQGIYEQKKREYESGVSGLNQQARDTILDNISQQMIELDETYSNLDLYLSDEEKDQIMQKAIETVQPYYDKKVSEIEAGIKEGKIQTAEDLLVELRQTEVEVGESLKKLDISEAQTEEEFVNTLAELTSQRDEDLEVNRLNWMERVDEARKTQVQKGVQTSGIGRKETTDLRTRQALEQAGIERRAGEKETALETGKKYSIENIKLAREGIERRRKLLLGEESFEDAQSKAAQEAGIDTDISEIELMRQRKARDISPLYGKEERMTALEEERKKDVLSRQAELESQRLSEKDIQSGLQYKKKKGELAKQYSSL